MTRKWSVYIALVAAMLATGSIAAYAQSWPTRAVKIVAPFPPGGAADTLGRIAADHLTIALGQPFIVENRAGAGGLIGAQAVAQAEPDGYTLVVSSIASNVIAPAMSAKPTFDTMKDFVHIAYLGGPPVVLVVHPSLGVRNFKDFIALAKSAPKSLGFVSPGAGTHGHLFAEYLAKLENLKLNHVPYRGSNPAMTDLIAGHVPIGSMSWSSAVEQIRTGHVLPLAVSSTERLPGFPNVPTFKELGFDLVAATWFSLSAPAGTPKPIVDKLNTEIIKILQLPDVQKRLALDAIEVRLQSPEEFTKFVAAEIARWQPIAKQLAASKE
jgi:tripartite-type tricarboxylate transporter receptor subunit TctC